MLLEEGREDNYATMNDTMSSSAEEPPDRNENEPRLLKPFFIMDWLESVDPQALAMAQKMLRTPTKEGRKLLERREKGHEENVNCTMTGRRLFSAPDLLTSSLKEEFGPTTSKLRTSTSFKALPSSLSVRDRSIAIGNAWNAKGLHKAELGAWKEALACWENALQIRAQVLGDVHIDVSNTCNNMGIVFGKLDQLDKAMQYLERALRIRAQSGCDYIEICATLHNMGNVFRQGGELNAALNCFSACKELLTNALGGARNLQVARNCVAMGHTLHQAKDFYGARNAYMEAFEVFRFLGLPVTHPEMEITHAEMKELDRVIARKDGVGGEGERLSQ